MRQVTDFQIVAGGVEAKKVTLHCAFNGDKFVIDRHRLIRFCKGLIYTWIWKQRGVQIADRVVIHGAPPHVAGSGKFEFGSRVSFRGFGGRVWLHAHPAAKIAIGDKTFLNSGVFIDASSAVTIGKNCLIGDNVVLQDSAYHQVGEGDAPRTAAITIGDNVWIARGSIILPGVTIGDHSVIGAGSVVTGPVPSKAVFAGNPARRIRDVAASDGFVRR